MERVFLKILGMNMAGTACILFVLVLRMFLRKKPRIFSYALWAVVFLRLLCPFALQSRYFGLTLGNMEQTLETAAYEQELVQYQLLVHKDGSVETLASRNMLRTPVPSADEAGMETSYPDSMDGNSHLQEGAWGTDRGTGTYLHQGNPVNRRYSRSVVQRLERGWVTTGSLIWAAGVVALLGYSLTSYLMLRRRLGQAVRVQE
ncbi:MAG: M56 family metallopeptidase, partial [Acetatifactor sp.]|nr:M56 family metallopeptidase [Acetatifactor sp.]